MRLSITVDPDLLAKAQGLSGTRTKRETIELALRDMFEIRGARKLIALKGSGAVDWDLEEFDRWRHGETEGP